MRILIITVAGTSTRFSRSIGKPCLKCLYSPEGFDKSLLYRMIHQEDQFDKYVIVGGYMYDRLKAAVNENFPEYRDRIMLVYNDKYAEYGSGYSLYKGIRAVYGMDFDELVFAEGDLFVDSESFKKICSADKDVITVNREDIMADKAVAFYFDANNKIHYLYDTGHKALRINEPFLSIFNSGQIWKFTKIQYLKEIYKNMSEEEWKGTNLVFIEKYFGGLGRDEYDLVKLNGWINCNTIDDFKRYINVCFKEE